MANSRYAHTATVLPSGKVLVVGGLGSTVFATTTLYDPASNVWTAAASLNTARYSHSATLLPSGKVLVVGGYSGTAEIASAELYDPATNSWSAAGSMMAARYAHSVTLLPSGKVLVTGGASASGARNSAEIYDPATNAWGAAPNMSTPRYYHSATLLPSGKVLVAAGTTGSGYLASAELFDPVANTWGAAPNLLPRQRHTATLLPSGKVLIASGEGSPTSAQLYDPVSNAWTTAGNLATGRSAASATLLPSGRVLVVGGIGNVASTELYDPVSNAWSSAGGLTTGRYGHTATLLPSGNVLVAGGYTGAALASAEVYEPSGPEVWTPAGALTITRYSHTATLLTSGKVLVVGGYNSGIGALTSAELYDPATNIWTSAGALATARSSHTATLLPSGKVLVVGSGSNTFASAELYDPVTNAWATAGALSTARNYHTATLLPSGKVLVVGGSSNSVTLASAEVYDPATNGWSAAGALATARDYHTATLLPSGKVLVVGGNDGSVTLASTEIYDPATNLWAAASALTTARLDHTTTLLPSGKALVVGGYNSGIGALASAELYDPATNVWTSAGALATARSSHTATLLPSGKVLVVGGANNVSGAFASGGLYDPATNAWSAIGALAIGRYFHSTKLLPSGKVLVVGGLDNTGDLASAELYAVDRGIDAARLPTITGVNSPVRAGDALALTGTKFLGDSEASSGSYNGSPTNSPLVQLRRLDNDAITWLNPATASTRSATSYQSVALPTGMPVGAYALTLYVNALPSEAKLIRVINTFDVTPNAGTGGSLTPSSVVAVVAGTATSFTVTANSGYSITSVTGCGGTLSGNTYTTGSINADCTVSASFTLNTYTITTSVSPSGAGSVTCSPNPVAHGGSSTCSQSPTAGYTFSGWSGACNGADPCALDNVTASASVTANYTLNTYAITTAVSPAGAGTVTCTPNPVNHGSGSTCSQTPATGYTFASWSGDCGPSTCSFSNVSSGKAVTANYTLNSYTVTTNVNPPVAGSVTCTPNPVPHGGNTSCTQTAAVGYTFTGWAGGACPGTTNPCTLTNLTGNTGITANYSLNTYAITISVSPAGTGTVACTPNPVSHSGNASCTTAPDSGYQTLSISGCGGATTGAGINNYSTGTISGACTVTATFGPSVVGVCGGANGIASLSAPTSNLCNAGSASSVTSGVNSFTWSCDGSVASSNSDDVACAAPRQYNVIAVVSPIAGGSVQCAPAPALAQSTVTCTGSAILPYVFDAWSGDCSGTTCTIVNVTADVSVTASFKPTLNVDGSDWPSGYSLLVDGVIVTRYMQGLRGTPLTQGLTDVTATITHTAQIANYLDSLGALLDIDGDGETKPSTDGLLILRFMLGLRGGALVADAVGANATRPTAAEIEAWLNALLPTVVGVCGSANGITSTTPPSTTLCSAGSPSSVTSGVSSFIWTCNGSIANSNADDVSCAAPRQ